MKKIFIIISRMEADYNRLLEIVSLHNRWDFFHRKSFKNYLAQKTSVVCHHL
jgi:hypothetical protein